MLRVLILLLSLNHAHRHLPGSSTFDVEGKRSEEDEQEDQDRDEDEGAVYPEETHESRQSVQRIPSTSKNRIKHFRIALGSAKESASAWIVLDAKGLVESDFYREDRGLLLEVVRMLSAMAPP